MAQAILEHERDHAQKKQKRARAKGMLSLFLEREVDAKAKTMESQRRQCDKGNVPNTQGVTISVQGVIAARSPAFLVFK